MMRARERILELVQKGIISTDEALILLENIETEKDEKLVNQEEQKTKTVIHATQFMQAEVYNQEKEYEKVEDPLSDIGDQVVDFQEHLNEKERQDREKLENILESLALEANQTSAQLDTVNEQLQQAKVSLKEKEEAVMIYDTMEDLEVSTAEHQSQRQKAVDEVNETSKTVEQLKEEKIRLEEKLKNINKEKKEEGESDWGEKLNIPDDWKEIASGTFNQMGEVGTQIGSLIKNTVKTVVTTVNDNVDWKDINMKVPGLANTKFEHEFYYPAVTASIIDVKVANGQVAFQSWEKEDIKIEASIKLYGKITEATPLEALLERSQIELNEEQLSFQIPNKRVRADLVFYLPAKLYDHVAVKMLNGDIAVSDLDMKDFYGKTTNGDIKLTQSSATMVEIQGVNGDMDIKDSTIMDVLAETVNGNITVKSDIENIHISNINGNVKITTDYTKLNKVEASLVNGTIKVALPQDIGFEGVAKTNVGSIKNRLLEYEIVREKKGKTKQMLEFRRISEMKMVQLDLSTTTGNIYLKNVE